MTNRQFIHALLFDQVVAPKKAKLAAATQEFEELMLALAAKKAILKQVEEKLAGLQLQLQQKGEEKAALDAEVLSCENVTNLRISILETIMIAYIHTYIALIP